MAGVPDAEPAVAAATKAAHPAQEGEDDVGPVSPEAKSYGRSLRSCGRSLSRVLNNLTSIEHGVCSNQNMRPKMEDAHCALVGAETPLSPFSFFAVFDGHGGSRCAEFASERLHGYLAEDRETLGEDAAEALKRAFRRIEADWTTVALENEWMDGTTAAVALVDSRTGELTVGNIGDSEVLLGTAYSDETTGFRVLSEVHHVNRNHDELSRITDVGGRIWRGRLGHSVINPQVVSLSISRSIGDLFFKHEKYTNGIDTGLSAEPYITSTQVVCDGKRATHQFLLVCCDGFWDTVTYQKATDVVAKMLQESGTQATSEALVRLAQEWGSRDNITVIVAQL